MPVTIRTATPADAALIHQFILDLADYEKLLDTVTASEADTAAALFGDNPRAFADIAELDGQPVGFSLWFYNYSTFVGRHGIWLEDLFVRPSARGSGAGKALLVNLAKRCVAEGLGRFEWSVLDWNAPSIAFYDSLGAATMDEWLIRRLTDDGIRKLAGV
ncbi:N-acetyltransferase family protein [Caulobacter segnis]